MAERTSRVKSNKKWNLSAAEDITRFIALVAKHPVLIERISPERLLPEWEKLVSVTGVSADAMATKWKRLCEKYRFELRQELKATPGSFKSNWMHFDQMAFTRSIEEKRIRMNRIVPTSVPASSVVCIKSEPGTQPTTSPKPGTSKDGMRMNGSVPTGVTASKVVRINADPGTQPSTSSKVGRISDPERSMLGHIKNFIPIERMLVTEKKPRLGSSRQEMLEDLQMQASRVVTSRGQQVNPAPSVIGIKSAPDNDFDFLMQRIYPYLSVMPEIAKSGCYERLQQVIVDYYRSIITSITMDDTSEPASEDVEFEGWC